MKKVVIGIAVLLLAAVLFMGADPDPVAGDRKTVTVSGESFNLRYIPATPAGGFQRDDKAANKTVITQGYWMAETEVTQELFEAVMGANPSGISGSPALGETQAKRPVECVSWYAAIAFCNKLSLRDGRTPAYSVRASGVEVDWATLVYSVIPPYPDADWDAASIVAGANGYRLPTEMQWMWAAMGATKGGATVTSAGYNKAFAGSTGSNAIGNYAWYDSNADDKTHQAGVRTANELGLYDMSGNVWEWCWDWWDDVTRDYAPGPLTDPTGAASGSYRVFRGGSWFDGASGCAVAIRGGSYPDGGVGSLGFRFLCP